MITLLIRKVMGKRTVSWSCMSSVIICDRSRVRMVEGKEISRAGVVHGVTTPSVPSGSSDDALGSGTACAVTNTGATRHMLKCKATQIGA
jgi:hypothetical protein